MNIKRLEFFKKNAITGINVDKSLYFPFVL